MLNLGTLEFILGINTRALDAARGRIQSFGDAVAQTQAKANRGIDTNIQGMRKIENAMLKATSQLNTFTNKINNSKLSPTVKLDMINKANQAFNALSQNIVKTGKLADGTKFDRGIAKFGNSVQGLGNKFTQATAQMSSMATAAIRNEAALQRQANAMTSNIEKVRNLSTAIRNSSIKDSQKIQLEDQLQGVSSKMRGSLGGGLLDSRGFNAAKNDMSAGLGDLRRKFADFKAEAAAPRMDGWKEFQSRIHGLGSSMLLINGHLGGMSTRLFALSTLMGTYGATAGLAAGATVGFGLALTTIVTKSLQVGMAMEKVEKGLIAVTGSTAIAASQLKFINAVSDQAGLKMTDVAKSFTSYLAASRSAGQTFEQTQHQFKSVALAAGTLSLSVEDTQGVFRALEQIMSKGTVQAEELRGQLGDRFPGAFAIAAKAVGKTTEELNKMMKKGEVISKDFLPKFVEALTKEYNIDLGKPVDTLQAALNNAQNAVDRFFLAFANNTQVMDAAKTVVKAFTAAVTFLAQNMTQIIRVVVGVTGAVVGATAAFFAMKAVILGWAALQFVIAWMGSFIALARVATSGTQLWTLAQVALNVAMMANPIGALLGLFARLAVVIGGAIFGYNMLTGAIDGSNAAAAQTQSIMQYITMQKALGYQVRSVTADLLKQAAVLQRGAAMRAQNAADELRSAAKGPGATDYFNAALRGGQRNAQGDTWTVKDSHTVRIKALVAEADAARKNAYAMRDMGAELIKVSKLPTQMPSASVPGAGDGKKDKGAKAAKEAEANISAVLELIRSYDLLQAKQAEMANGPEGFLQLDALAEAQNMVREFSTKELAMADAALIKAGYSSGTLEERLAALSLSTDKAKKSVAEFTKSWETVTSTLEEVALLKDKIAFLQGGGSTDFLFNFDNMAKAKAMVKDLDEHGLAALQKRMISLGYIAGTLTENLALMFDGMVIDEKTLEGIERARSMLQDIADRSNAIQTETNGINMGLSGDELDSWVTRTLAIAEYTNVLKRAQVGQTDFNSMMAAFIAGLDNLDNIDLANKRAKEMQNFRDDIAESMATAVSSVISSFGNIRDAAKTLINDLAAMFTKQFITKPLMDMFTNILSSIKFTGFADGGAVKAANGGFIQGPGTSRSDSIPAWLSDGEFVMNARAVKKLGVDRLQAMNSGKDAPGFFLGGLAKKGFFGIAGKALSGKKGGKELLKSGLFGVGGMLLGGGKKSALGAAFGVAGMSGLLGGGKKSEFSASSTMGIGSRGKYSAIGGSFNDNGRDAANDESMGGMNLNGPIHVHLPPGNYGSPTKARQTASQAAIGFRERIERTNLRGL